MDYELDAASGLYRFKKIYPGENWDASLRSPLTEPGVVVKEGDYLIAVNGRDLKAPHAPNELFVNTAGQNVTLTVNSQPSATGTHNIVVKPLSTEYPLRQLDMVNTNRRKVDQATGGRVGYIYIPDMSGEGLSQFVKQFFPQIRKQGLIIDVRYNGGGFVDQLIFERLRRVLAGMDSARNFASGTIPDVVFNGSMVCITNHYAASDGDIFSYFFKKYHLGPLIGTRTWGGVRGIRGYIPLMDGGYITRPEFSVYALDSQWVIENHGVEPDIEIDNRPDLVMKGQDPQLEKAIEVVMKAIQEHPKRLAPRPPEPPGLPQWARVERKAVGRRQKAESGRQKAESGRLAEARIVGPTVRQVCDARLCFSADLILRMRIAWAAVLTLCRSQVTFCRIAYNDRFFNNFSGSGDEKCRSRVFVFSNFSG